MTVDEFIDRCYSDSEYRETLQSEISDLKSAFSKKELQEHREQIKHLLECYGIRNQHILSTPPLEQPSRLVNNSSCSVPPPSGITNKDILINLGGDLINIIKGYKCKIN